MPKKYFAEHSVRELPVFSHLISKHPEIQMIDDYQSFRQQTMHREKQCVIFAKKRGAWLKPFHCYHHNPEYKYFSLDAAEGCSFDCVYCYLQSYLNHGALVLFVNQDGLAEELIQQQNSRLWISTGLLSDSLLAENEYPVISKISHLLPPNSILELRTKSADLNSLQDHAIDKNRVVISWSLNPEKTAVEFEYGTASPADRIQAAHSAAAFGYKVGFHFDPVFYFEGWEKEYSKIFEALSGFESNQIAFLSLGLFRYMPELGSIIRKRFPYHSILSGEFFLDMDGKYHYLRAIRKEMYAKFSEWFKPWKGSVPILWSMEPDERLINAL